MVGVNFTKNSLFTEVKCFDTNPHCTLLAWIRATLCFLVRLLLLRTIIAIANSCFAVGKLIPFRHTQVSAVVPGFYVWGPATIVAPLSAVPSHLHRRREGEWRVLCQDGEPGREWGREGGGEGGE